MHGDLFRWLGGEEPLFALEAFLFNFLLLLAVYFLGRAVGRWRKLSSGGPIGRLLGYGAPAVVVFVALFLYPTLKGFMAVRSSQFRETSVVVLLDRNVYYPEESRWRGLVVSANPDFSLQSLPQEWPFSLLQPGTTALRRVSNNQLRQILEALRKSSFFELPEQLDPRPSLDHAALYLAVHQDGVTKRAFGRVSDQGFQHLASAAEALLRQLGLGRDWWMGSQE
jgi:hypothetical protein